MPINTQWLVLIGVSVLVSSMVSAQAVLESIHSTRVDAKPLMQLEHAIDRGEYPKTTSILIIRNGRLAYERYFGEGNQEFLNNTRSATKFLTTLALGAAIGDHAIPSEHVRAFQYLSELEPFQNDSADKHAITLEDMLTMSSALACDDNDEASPGNEDNMHSQSNWTRWAVDLPTMQTFARDAQGLGPWRYCTTNAFLLGQVIQRATHVRVDHYTESKILRPLGISKWNWSYSPAQEVMTGGGLQLRSRDLAKIAWMVADNGRWKGQQIVPAGWVESALTIRRASRPGQNYGYFIFEETYSTACGMQPVWYMAGNGGSQILALRDLEAAVVITRTAFNVHGSSAQTADMLKKYILPSLPCAHHN
jgi:CubicO group peptidase (beta-lactamase class C family)